MMMKPISASATSGVPKLPRATVVDGSAITILAPTRPMSAMKRPIPTVIPYLRF